jgi:hypothetical protein
MAKRKAKKAATKRQYRRVGAIKKPGLDDAMEAVGLVLSSIGGTIIQRQFTTINPKIVSVMQLAGGYFLKSSNQPLIRGMGWGLVGTGAIGLTHQLGVINGIEDMVSGMYQDGYMMDTNEMQGIQNESFVAGIANESRIAGQGMYNAMMPMMGM